MLYYERENLAAGILEKIKAGIPLSDDEFEFTKVALVDPLSEFCMREGTFRLTQMHGVSDDVASMAEDVAAEVVMDVINGLESLYDEIDSRIDEVMEEEIMKEGGQA